MGRTLWQLYMSSLRSDLTFLSGLARTLDAAGIIDNLRRDYAPQGSYATYSDWEQVGEDLRVSIGAMQNKLHEQAQGQIGQE